MTVMVVMSPCALVISVPATVLSAIGGAARMGVLFKGGVHLERTATLELFALDKTGTLTLGMPSVRQVQPWHGDSPGELLRLAAAVSERSEHPIARAFVRRAQEDGLVLPPATDFRVFVGLGTEAVVSGRRITVGNMRKLVGDGGCGDIIAHSAAVDAAAQLGQTPVGVAERQGDGTVRVLGMITVADTIRPEAREAMAALRDCGIRRLVMITGDDRRVANAVAREIGLDEVHAELLPEDKVKVVKSLGEQGPVAMVGDGVNDAPSLAAATVGIAMGTGGTDIALETADVVLMGNRLEHLARAVRISRQARRVIFQNLVFAGGVMLLLTVSTLIGHVPLTLGVAGHEGSTIVVCLNGLRLLWVSKYA
jgi:Cd2+/Zn2+-exporting ATPase